MIFKRERTSEDVDDTTYHITLAPGEAFDLLQRITAETELHFPEESNYETVNDRAIVQLDPLTELHLHLTDAMRDLVLGVEE